MSLPRVTISIYKIDEFGSGGYQVLNKVSDFFYPLGTHPLSLDTTSTTTDKYLIYMNYNSNDTKISLKYKGKNKYYNVVNNPSSHYYPYGYKLIPNGIFNRIVVTEKNNHAIREGFSDGCIFSKIFWYIVVPYFIYYLYKKNQPFKNLL